MATPTHKPLFPALQRAIASDRSTTFVRSPPALDPEHVADLKAVVRRRLVPAEPVNMVRAVRTLAWTERTPEVAAILSGVLADENESANTRAVAAIELRHLPAAEAQKGLIPQLGLANLQIRHQVIKTLGIVGDEHALESLDAIPEPRLATLRRQLVFSRALIAHRLGLARNDLPFHPGEKRVAPPGARLIPLTLRPVPSGELARERSLLLGTTYSIDVGQRAFTLRAGAAEWTVFVNNQLAGTAVLNGIIQRKWITALLARREPLTGDSMVQYVVLTNPRDGGVEIQVLRSDGEVFYSGRASSGRDLLQFDVQDIDRKGTAPTNVRRSSSSSSSSVAVVVGRSSVVVGRCRRSLSPGCGSRWLQRGNRSHFSSNVQGPVARVEAQHDQGYVDPIKQDLHSDQRSRISATVLDGSTCRRHRSPVSWLPRIHSPPPGGSGVDRLLCRSLKTSNRSSPGSFD